VPVLLFHGAMDHVVYIAQSRHMAERLAAARVPHERITRKDLGHRLDDSAARAEMLRKTDDFLRAALRPVKH
jgi:dipeptidyl aminopeptidase/acylaminoacyl peptidase